MSATFNIMSSILATLLLLGCLWLANRAYVEIEIASTLRPSALARLALVIALAGLLYIPASAVMSNLLAVFQSTSSYYTVAFKAVEFIGAVLVLVFVGWLYVKARVEES